MTVSSETRTAGPFTGNGVTTAFPFTFRVFAQTDVLVVQTDTDGVEDELTLTTDYTVALNADQNDNPGGTVTLNSALTTDYLLTLTSQIQNTQLTELTNGGGFYPSVITAALDKAVVLIQQLLNKVNRSIKVPISDGTSVTTELPTASLRANKAVVFNADGNITVSADDYDDQAANAAASAAAAASSASAASTSASSASSSASSASSSASSASASAAAATAALNSALWRDVVFVTVADSPITLSSSDNGKLYRCDTSGGAITLNLPQISGLTLPFNVSIKKETSDANAITVNRAGTDTIDGATSKTLSTYGGGSTFLADTDPAPDQWTAALFGQAEDGSITTAKYADSSITSAKIADGNVPHDKLSTAFRKSLNLVQDFRLTLTTGTPVTTNDVTGATTVYCTPYTGNSIALYDGTNWNIRTSAEFSLALGTLTSGKPYDVFCYDNAGTPTLEFLVWTNDTTRATALDYQDGVLVKSGTATRRYLGTFYTTATTTTEDSVSKRFLWNYYNRVNKTLFVTDATATWNYTTATVRQARASAANQVEVVVGVNEDAVSADLQVTFANSSANVTVIAGFGLDSTTGFAADQLRAAARTQVAGTVCSAFAKFLGYVGVGRHYLAWLEYSTATGTTTWTGSNDGSSQTGIRGLIRC